MNKILITGGNGFIGTNLIDHLLKDEYKIINLDKLSYCSIYNKKINSKKYRFIKIDLAKNFLRLSKIIKSFKPDYIINIAANSHVDNSIQNPIDFVKTNHDITLNLLGCILKNKLMNKLIFIHIGTDEIYGDIKQGEKKIFNELSCVNPSSPYSASKAACHFLIKSFSRTYKLQYQIINPSNNFGPFQYFDKLIPKTINCILKNKPVEIFKRGQNIRQWVHVSDTCKIIIKLLKIKKINQVFNIGHGKLITNIKLVRMIIQLINKNLKKNKKVKIKYISDRKGHDYKYKSSNLKLSKIMIFKKVNFKKKLDETVKWYLNSNNLKYFKK